MDQRPGVLCIGGHDPTGGAGLHADIETLQALGARTYGLVTCLTAQDTHNVVELTPTPAAVFRQQRDTLLADIRPDAIKIGLLGSVEIATAVGELLADFEGPIVLDPILRAGGGRSLSTEELIAQLREELLPRCHLLTPNQAELAQLTECADIETAAERLLQRGARGVLVTGADAAEHAQQDQVSNTLYRPGHSPQTWNWPHLPHVYHGSGCTLASACAARLAAGVSLVDAAEAAQRFTWDALRRAERPGHGQHLPTRST